MKKYLCWLLLLLLLLGGCAQKAPVVSGAVGVTVHLQGEDETPLPAVEGYEDFMAVLSAALIDGQSNKNLSPVSVYIALSMAAEGARGETRAELLALLGEQSLEELRNSVEGLLNSLHLTGETGELMLANSLWMGAQDGTASFHEAYLDVLKTSYGAEANAVRFGETAAGERIKAWIEEKTRDKIKVSEDAMDFDANTLAVLLNTIYLRDQWRVPFDRALTEQGVFYGPAGERQAEYMRRTEYDGTVFRGEGYLRYALPLNEAGAMVFVLPDEGTALESLLGSPEQIEELLQGGDKVFAEVDLMVPRFSFQDRTDLEETLLFLGVRTCFTDGADFSLMTDAPMCVSRVLQESCIGVDEAGVVAAAYTLIAFTKGMAIPVARERVDFHLIRPFLYAIESRDGTILFLGTVTAPDQA